MSVRNDNFPRAFDATIRFNHRFRYQCNTGGTFTYTRASLLNLLVEGLTTTLLGRLIAAIRINQITLYGIGTSTASAPIGLNTVSVEWLSDLGTTVIKSDTGNSIEPAKVVSGPPLNSRAHFWSRSGFNESEQVFQLKIQTGNIVDFDVSIVLFNDDTPVTTAAAGVVAGQMYQINNGNLVPVSYPGI